VKKIRFFIFLIFCLYAAAGYYSISLAAENADPKLKDGEEFYQKNCSVCHGDKGDANTWVSHDLNPKPKNFTDPLVIKTLNRKKMFDAITKGRPGTAMQPFKTQLSEAEINLIIDYIQTAFMKIDVKAKKKK